MSQGALNCPVPAQMTWLSDGGPTGFPNAPAAGIRPVRGNKKPVTVFGSGFTDSRHLSAPGSEGCQELFSHEDIFK